MVSLSSLFLQETMCSFFLPEAIIRRPVNCTTESHRPQMKCTLTLIVFNTCTQEYEEVIVTEEVYRTYCRTRWNIKDNDQSFFDHEIQTSGMIGSQDGAYENFREFIDAINTPEHIILEQIKKEALYQAISALPAADQALVQGLFFKGQSELDYAREIGVSQPAVHKRKVRILKSLKKLLEN